MHEYSHLWIKAIRKNNRELYDNLMDLFSRKNLPQMYEELDNDPNYADLSERVAYSEVEGHVVLPAQAVGCGAPLFAFGDA